VRGPSPTHVQNGPAGPHIPKKPNHCAVRAT
jgi:hypothetical protein